MNVSYFLEKLDFYLWDGLLLYLLVGVGLYLTYKLKGMQFKYLLLSLKYVFSKHDNNTKGDISQFQSLMTALAATIGIGSIAGMATAVVAGGFGSIFWMWLVALIGMVTKYSEAILAVKYRTQDQNNKIAGGPMYYIQKGLKIKWLAVLFSVFGILATFGGGNIIQSQSIAHALNALFDIPYVISGIVIALLAFIAIIGGIKNLGKINAYLVPVMALIYITGGIVILLIHVNSILPAIGLIIKSAFSKKAAYGGFIGGGIFHAVQIGISRGISSNEAGLGSAPIAAAAAKTDFPGRQALISMSGVFLSSFIVCTITVLVLSVTQVVGDLDAEGRVLNGAPLVMKAFSNVLPYGEYIVALGLVLFGFSTILGWAYYGEKCVEYTFAKKAVIYYRFLFVFIVFVGAVSSIKIVWPIADIFNGLMALPNLIGLMFLSKIIISESNEFFEILKIEKKRKIKKKVLGFSED